MNEFKNRDGLHLNRKSYVVEENSIERNENGDMISFVATEIRNDEPYENKEGTPLNAENLNQITENIMYNILENLEGTVSNMVNNFTIETLYVNDCYLPGSIDDVIMITWEAVTPNVTVNNNYLEFSRTDYAQEARIKGIFKYAFVTIEKEFDIMLKGKLYTNVTTDLEQTVAFIQGVTNRFETVLKTDDSSQLVLDYSHLDPESSPIYYDNSDVLEYFNLDFEQNTPDEIKVIITEKPFIRLLNKTGKEIFPFFIDFYIDNVDDYADRQLVVEIEYNYSSTNPED